MHEVRTIPLFDSAKVQAVIRQPVPAKTLVRSQSIHVGDFWWTKWDWDRVFSELFGSFFVVIPPMLHTHISFIYDR
jgi:hypothetical protein